MTTVPVTDLLTGMSLDKAVPAPRKLDKAVPAPRKGVAAMERTPVTRRLEAIEALIHWIPYCREWLLDRIVARSAGCVDAPQDWPIEKRCGTA